MVWLQKEGDAQAVGGDDRQGQHVEILSREPPLTARVEVFLPRALYEGVLDEFLMNGSVKAPDKAIGLRSAYLNGLVT